jgi:hypothetical protein
MRRLQLKDPTLVQVLSLFLLLLAFFIVLFNASRFDRGRADAVGESLTSAFRTKGQQTSAPRPFSSMTGEAPGDALFLEKLGELVRAEIEVAQVDTVRPGRILRIRVPTDALFLEGRDDVRPERAPFVSAFARLIGSPETGRRHKAEIYVGSDWITPDAIRSGVPLPISRAARLTETVLANGAVVGTVMAGVRPDDSGVVTIFFRIDPDLRPSETAPGADGGHAR